MNESSLIRSLRARPRSSFSVSQTILNRTPARPGPSARCARRERAAGEFSRTGVVILITSGLFLLAGVGALWLAQVDPLEFKARIDAASPDGVAISFPLERTQILQWRLGAYGLGLCLAGLCAIVFRRRLGETTCRILREGAELRAEWRTNLRAWFRDERTQVVSLGLIVIVAALLRFAFLHQDMRYDEADAYLMYASRSLLLGLSDYPEPGNHLLVTLLVHVSVGLFGDAPWAVRLPTLIAGILLVPVVYIAVRGWLGRWPALLSAGLSASSSYLVHYSVNARGYIFVVLAFCLGLVVCNRLAERPNRAAAMIFGVVSALGFHAMPTMLFPFGASLVWLVVIALRRTDDPHSRERVRDIVLAGAATAVFALVLYGPVLVVSGPAAVTTNKYVSVTSWSDLTALLGLRLAILATELTRTPAVAILLVLGLVAWLVRDLRRGAHALALPAALIAWCALLVVLLRTPPYGRVWTFAMPVFYALGAAGLVAIVSRFFARRPAALVVLALGLTAWLGLDTLRTRSPSLSPEGERFESAQDMAAYFQGNLAPEERVLAVSPARAPLWYYMRHAGFPADVLSYDEGSSAFTYAVLCVPLEEFNAVVGEWDIPPVDDQRLQRVQEFPGAVVCRIDPPLPCRERMHTARAHGTDDVSRSASHAGADEPRPRPLLGSPAPPP